MYTYIIKIINIIGTGAAWEQCLYINRYLFTINICKRSVYDAHETEKQQTGWPGHTDTHWEQKRESERREREKERRKEKERETDRKTTTRTDYSYYSGEVCVFFIYIYLYIRFFF